MDIYKRLDALNLTLPTPPKAGGLYVTSHISGNLLFTSGHDCVDETGNYPFLGKIGVEVTLEEGIEAARLTALNCLATIEEKLGDLNRVTKIIKLLCFVYSNPDFHKQPLVTNGASQLLVDIFGEKGRHARTSVSAASLPFNIPVEIEMVVEFQ